MADLILRPSRINPDRPWALQLRWHDLSGTSYQTIARVDETTARQIAEAGAPSWLLGEPKEAGS
jgi:hypothetical protein